MIDHRREGSRQGVGMVFVQTRFGGFFIACEKVFLPILPKPGETEGGFMRYGGVRECIRHYGIAKGLHDLKVNRSFYPASGPVILDPTSGEQGVRQDQGRSTIAGKAADRELEWSWKNPLRRVFCCLEKSGGLENVRTASCAVLTR
ncbi:hypothetical protein [Pseudomonas cichorii]|uniref:hypothetical protein n=1 Tax=Pseudomonas cichorii TaxID=36746 RepID=UPI00160541D0|nr:hypothetical protein [Pseudomonas cichorii]